ncbi:hypothetical protein GPECTOR_22g834 [Gonium pectorale]|uniref:Protein ENHANCED DISEASE RESISTANCE 2 C-terminal domain-containing protein n=1 Tax=Gonium pectorale TaxID=33097 RepID=A0A150GHB7_GONPE|nr:hypothetical protein GPECTOR_22g834 [Gonium pectorale]|eukprot:KXZ49242.1 hypothetical protein GPECTOR_22g834 [Gonium pectorale]
MDSLRYESGYLAGTSEASEEPLNGAGGMLTGCLSILENIRIPAIPGIPGVAPAASATGAPGGASGAAGHPGGPGGSAADGGTARRLGGKLEPGITLKHRGISASTLDVRDCWEECGGEAEGGDGPSTSGRPFMVRGPDYMRTKVKVPCGRPLYRLLASDVITSETKLTHVARLANLQHLLRPASDPHLPPLLILTIMLPMYPASFFGANDGPSQSLIYYFGLPPDFNAATFENQAALALVRRFVTNGREADGSPTRDRFKLIPRVVNVEEWAQKGPLSPAEHKLLSTYNEKPVLTRPQHFFFHGPGYLEVDIDIHAYQFLARRAFGAYFTRLPEVVFENAFIIQGNSPEELPEQVLAAVRMYRIDLARNRPLRDYITPGANTASAGTGACSKSCPDGDEAIAADSDISSLYG